MADVLMGTARRMGTFCTNSDEVESRRDCNTIQIGSAGGKPLRKQSRKKNTADAWKEFAAFQETSVVTGKVTSG